MRDCVARLALSLLVATNWLLLAEDTPAAKDSLPELVVTATRTEKDREDVAQSLTVIGPEILERQPERTVGDLLRDVPGVNLNVQSNPGMKRVGIRGERPNRVLILIDGQKLTENKSMAGPPMLLTAGSVERIEIIRGPGSVLYGSEALGGVVNIITKKGGPNPVGGSLDYTYDTTSKGWGTSLSLAGSLDHFEYNLSGTVLDHGNRRTPGGTLPDTGFEAFEGSAYIGWREEAFAVGVRYDNYQSDVNSYWDYPTPTLPAGSIDLPDWDRESLSLFLDIFDPMPNLERIHVDAYYQTTYKKLDQSFNMFMGPRLTDMDVHTENDQDTLGLSLQLDWRFGNHAVTTGADWRRDGLDAASDTTIVFLDKLPPFQVATSSRDEATQQHLALFVRDEWQFAEGWTAEFGIRHTWVRSELEWTNSAIPEETTRDRQAVFSAALVNRSLADWTFRLGYSQGHRFPSLQELYTQSTSSLDGRPIMPNADLEPETIQSLEFGARYAKGALDVDATIFYSQSEDYIAWRSVGPSYQYQNIEESRSFGLELAASYRIEMSTAAALTPYLVGTWMRKCYEEDTGTTSYDTGNPLIQGRFGVRGDWNRAWFDLFARAADGVRDDSPEPPAGYDTTAGWATLNLEVGYAWQQAVGNGIDWRVSAGLENLFDREYVVAGEWIPAPGRNLFVKLGCTF
ncbi:MAG: TonB-dependent receptor [Lentisphaeria bacterium]|jgi:hemoglobin/transferrin/lactoferrin receptor protein|nr:TonB-dependent receptor [Lentisphaeria bacterium]